MRSTRQRMMALTAALILAGGIHAQTGPNASYPPVTLLPPESFFQKGPREKTGTPPGILQKVPGCQRHAGGGRGRVSGPGAAADLRIVTHMLAGRPDVVKAMVDQGMYLIIIGKDQVYTDMPEYRHAPTRPITTSASAARAAFPPASARRTC